MLPWLTNYFTISTILLYIAIFLFYAKISKGLGNKAFYLQMRRFLPCILAVTLPPYLADTSLLSSAFIAPLLVGIAWIITYPTLYFMTYKNSAVSFSYHFDIVIGLYLSSFFICLSILCAHFHIMSLPVIILFTVLEFILLLIPVFQLSYYSIYHACLSETGMMAVQQTDKNEALEFLYALTWKTKIISTGALICLGTLLLYYNISAATTLSHISLDIKAIVFFTALTIFLAYYLSRPDPETGAFLRTGFMELYIDVKEYFKVSGQYTAYHQANLPNLEVNLSTPLPEKPQTFILVIGESASRDHMSLFSNYERDTTPWLSAHKNSSEFFLFKNSYACWHQTVPVLERALTELNQYNAKTFNTSFSILDIAKKAGFDTYWFSNQGYVGSVDTPVTLIANTADRAAWTKQEITKKQCDEALLEYLPTVDPTKNNFIIFHLMGSHDNFQTRYPEEFTIWGTPGKYHLIDNYDNSLAYTDYLLKEIYTYATEHLNLQGLVYFSDHSTIPDKRRQPDFTDFLTVRIPMFVYLSDNYQKAHPDVSLALRKHENSYWTNDLTYDLVCGILKVQSPNYDATQSLASSEYRFSRENLTTLLGEMPLTADQTEN